MQLKPNPALASGLDVDLHLDGLGAVDADGLEEARGVGEGQREGGRSDRQSLIHQEVRQEHGRVVRHRIRGINFLEFIPEFTRHLRSLHNGFFQVAPEGDGKGDGSELVLELDVAFLLIVLEADVGWDHYVGLVGGGVPLHLEVLLQGRREARSDQIVDSFFNCCFFQVAPEGDGKGDGSELVLELDVAFLLIVLEADVGWDHYVGLVGGGVPLHLEVLLQGRREARSDQIVDSYLQLLRTSLDLLEQNI
eukprot:CAMPEP_0170568214 /NCGR_PEP_ID=MMETSP0211-20121228/81019_1 /TAXON_ID=311385 /ORGANISM="Pseudokeronopsis sp., Strain OXSARD2" /LENGTH=249 /DNA_ID=CAMNT_0010889969 /DNA_START=46 /DNA_END=795 /DNA_ORIENTATION=+